MTNKEKTAKILAKYLPISETKSLKALNPSNKNTFQVEFGTAGKISLLQQKKKLNHIS